MPTFQGQLSEEEVIGLVAYIKALGNGSANLPLPVSNPDSGDYPVAPKPENSAAKSDQRHLRARRATQSYAGESRGKAVEGESWKQRATRPKPKTNYLNADYGIKSWLLTTDHKRIALLYLMSITLFFFLGGFFAMLIRLELLTPAGDLVLADTYNKLFTMHGIVMIFLFLIPSVPAVLRQLSGSDDDRGQGSGLPQVEPGELVHLHGSGLPSSATPS